MGFLMEELCKTCKYWDKGNPEIPQECRRYPPVVVRPASHCCGPKHEVGMDLEESVEEEEVDDWGWPLTWGFHWCGEWKGIEV